MIGRVNTGGGIKLPFRVIGGTTQPSNPKDGDIWVKTSVPIMRTEFANGTWASGGVGLVFLAGTLGGSNPTGANSTVWAINKNTGTDKYILKITLTGCKQVQGSKGNWVNLYAYRYYGGTWVQFSSENVIPEFTYTGDFEIVNDSDEPITTSQDNWKIRLLTSGTLTFQDLNGAENGIDVFLVGGGGSTTESWSMPGDVDMRGGGGGGYTTTKKDVPVNTETPYNIVVGAGASDAAGAGGASTAFGQSAAGGSGTITVIYGGGAGGSGGGGRAPYNTANPTDYGKGGSDGSDGFPESASRANGGKGQGATTREFGESGGKIYAGGGGGSTYSQWTPSTAPGGYGGEGGGGRGGNTNCNPTPGEANTGGGGGGGVRTCAAGGSGIVVIRNKR